MRSRQGMSEKVKTIKDRATINKILFILKNNFKYGERNQMIFEFSYNSLLRMGDTLKTTTSDIYNHDGTVKSSFTLKEQKTGKDKTVYLDVSNFKHELERYHNWLKKNHIFSDFLFPVIHPRYHHTKHLNTYSGVDRHLTTQRYYHILKRVQHILKLPYSLGNHTPRKSAAFHIYVKSHYDIGFLMSLLNHTSQSATLHYIGLEQESTHKKLNQYLQ